MREIGTEGLKGLAAGKQRRRARLVRDPSTDAGRFGVYTSDSGLQLYMGEPPWRDNRPDVSHIRPGPGDPPMSYECEPVLSQKFGFCYAVNGVEGRDLIRIHVGNFVGDVEKGYKSNSKGCICPGRALGEIAGQPAVLSSRDAFNALVRDMEGEGFTLTIENKEA